MLIFLGMILTALVMGTVGFIVIEDYPPFDAFYMALTTVATVGYKEVHELSTLGRVFNSVLIAFGVTSIFAGVGAVTQTVIELELGGYFPKRRAKRMIDKLHDHFIVCGFGRVGRSAAAELRHANVPFIVLDRSEQKVERATREGYLAALGDASMDTNLRNVGIERSRGLIAALATDADNLFLVISAKTLKPGLNVATRLIEEEAEHKFRRAGADAVFTPYTMAGSRLAQAILRPHVVQFLEVATAESDLKVTIEQVRVQPGTPIPGQSLRQLNLRKETGVIVLAIRRPTGEMIFNPDPELVIQEGDFLISMGTEAQLRTLTEFVAEAHA
jgi:voltage-gated potassium channel